MATEILMPRLGWTMEEGTFGEWLQPDGAEIRPGDLLCTVEGDKATQEIEAFDSGILRIPPDGPQPGDVIPVGGLLAYLVQPGEHAPFEDDDAASQAEEHGVAVASSASPPGQSPSPAVADAPRRRNGEPTISPRARRVARELGVEWILLTGSGRTGRIVERDVRAAAESLAQTAVETPSVRATPVAQRMAEAEGIDVAALASGKPDGDRIRRQDVEEAVAARAQSQAAPATQEPSSGQAIPVGRVRRLIATRMVESSRTTAPVTLTTEADATEFVRLREQFKTTFAPRGLAVPAYHDLLIKLTAVALQEHPLLNATWNETEIIVHKAIHMAFAVDTDEGLLAPVIPDVQDKSVREVMAVSGSLIEQARAQRIDAAALQGGTFTITNLGAYGIDAFTPIINLPQCAILGVGRIRSVPAVFEGEIVPRELMALSLTFDHRLVDGGPAARFLNTVREYIETPSLWLIA